MTYPLKFRQHILAVRETERLTLKEASERFCIGEASLSRWIKKIEPQTTRHKPATKVDRDALAQDVKSHPDAYQREGAVRFGVSAACLQFALKRLGITHKKRPLTPPKRIQFQHMIQAHEPSGDPIIYIDESGLAVDMPSAYGYAPRGERCLGTHDWQAKGRMNVMGALQGSTLLTTCLCNANLDSATFHAWVTQQLLPVLPQKSVRVMDNATFHKRQATQDAIQSNGHRLRFLPPYSPDLNPIEHPWAHAIALRRTMQCPVQTLFSQNYL